MGQWKWLAFALGLLLIVVASFGFSAPVFSPTTMRAPQEAPSFQIILGIGGLAAIIWGIIGAD